jgi:hypothetical protein
LRRSRARRGWAGALLVSHSSAIEVLHAAIESFDPAF